MDKKEKGYILPIAISLLYVAVGLTGYLFMKSQNYQMFIYMILSFIGLMANTLRRSDFIWKSEGRMLSSITGLLIMAFSWVSSVNYYLEGTKYLGGILSIIMLVTFLYKFIKKAEFKERPIIFVIIIILLIVCIVETAYRTIYFPKNEIAYVVENW